MTKLEYKKFLAEAETAEAEVAKEMEAFRNECACLAYADSSEEVEAELRENPAGSPHFAWKEGTYDSHVLESYGHEYDTIPLDQDLLRSLAKSTNNNDRQTYSAFRLRRGRHSELVITRHSPPTIKSDSGPISIGGSGYSKQD